MPEAILHDVPLPGCTPEPLMAYLKALGVLRLVSEQKDPNARGYWKNDAFQLRSSLEKDGLARFFLEEYKPTPIIAPWAGGSGFFKDDNIEAVEAIYRSVSLRCTDYSFAIRKAREIIAAEKISEKPKDDDKARLIRRYRRELPDSVVAWMDTVLAVQTTGQAFAPLFGSGGNDGRLDFTLNFMQRIRTLKLHEAGPADKQSCGWLENALSGAVTNLSQASVGQFSPGRAGGPNATQGMEGGPTDNPWDFVLMIEGAIVLAAAAVRRLCPGDPHSSRGSFPFTVRTVAAGFGTPAANDAQGSRGELWLPLWTHPTGLPELRQLFGEARAEISGRPAENGIEFAQAVAGLGVDRGLSVFNRFAFLKRSGKAYLATPIGRFHVESRAMIDLLRELGSTLEPLRRAAGDKNTPARFGSALHEIDTATFDFCKYGGKVHFRRVLVALGYVERALAQSTRFREEKKLRPLSGLAAQWIKAADDNSTEFAVARSLASIYDAGKKIGPLRANLEPVDGQGRYPTWAENGRSIVWNGAGLCENMANILQRRVIDGSQKGCRELPLESRLRISLSSIAEFIDGNLDDDLIGNLLWGLILVRGDGHENLPRATTSKIPLPRAYALLKLLFLPRPLLIANGEDGLQHARLARNDEKNGIKIRPESAILSLVRSGRLDDALAIAARRLRISGLMPLPQKWREIDRQSGWKELAVGINPVRLSAALLIPIDDPGVNEIYRLCIRGEDDSKN